jgi:hypothetical protein
VIKVGAVINRTSPDLAIEARDGGVQLVNVDGRTTLAPRSSNSRRRLTASRSHKPRFGRAHGIEGEGEELERVDHLHGDVNLRLYNRLDALTRLRIVNADVFISLDDANRVRRVCQLGLAFRMIINARLVISSPLSRSRSASCGSDLGSNARAALTRAVNGAAGLTAIDLKTAAASKSGPGSSTAIGGAIAGCGFGGLPAPARAPPHVFSRFRLIFLAFPCFSIIAENRIGHTKLRACGLAGLQWEVVLA